MGTALVRELHEVALDQAGHVLTGMNKTVQSCTLAALVARIGALRAHLGRVRARLEELEHTILDLTREEERARGDWP
jgi:hypothetical protein